MCLSECFPQSYTFSGLSDMLSYVNESERTITEEENPSLFEFCIDPLVDKEGLSEAIPEQLPALSLDNREKSVPLKESTTLSTIETPITRKRQAKCLEKTKSMEERFDS